MDEKATSSNESQSAGRRLVLACGIGAFFFLLTAYLTWPLPIRMANGINSTPDSLLNFWALAWNYHILPSDPLSYFNANIFFPRQDTLAYSEHLFGVALVAAPAYLATGNVLFAYNFAIAASFVLSGLGMYLLVHELTGSRWAALLSGIIYAAAPFRFLHLYHLQILSYQWFPFVFLFLDRFVREGHPRQMIAAAFFAALQILSCNYYAMYLAIALALFAIVVALAGRSLMSPKKLLLLAAGAGGVALIALPFFLPYERNREQQGFYRRYEDVVQFSAEPLDYLRPSAFNKVFYAQYLPRQLRSEKALFPGTMAILLGGLGLFGIRRRDSDEGVGPRLMRIFFSALLGVGFVLSLGPVAEIGGEALYLPYRFLYRYVPGFGGMRVPARLSALVLLGLAVLAGWGLTRLLKNAGRWRHWCGAAAIVLVVLEYQTFSLARILPPAPSIPAVYDWLALQPGDFGVLELPIHEDITREAMYMYYSTTHWKKLANGFSGWWPNDYWVLVGRMRYFPLSGILRFLERDVPVRLVIIHYEKFPERQRAKLRHDMYRYRNRLPVRAQFGEDVVYELLPEQPTEPTKPLEPSKPLEPPKEDP
jgi:hypothetical protein